MTDRPLPILDLGPFEAPTTVAGWCRVKLARSTAARRAAEIKRAKSNKGG